MRFRLGDPGILDRRIWLLTYGQAVQSIGRGVIMPFATIYFYAQQGFPLALIGLAFAIAMPTGAIVGLVWGAVADRIGRKPLMIVGFAGYAVTTMLLAFVTTVPQYVAVIIANSVAVSAWNPAARAMVADVTAPDRRTRAYGMLYLANNAGMSAGLLLGGILAIFVPYRALFFFEAAGGVAYLLVVLLFVKESHARGTVPVASRGLARVAEHFRGVSTPLRDARFLIFGLATVLAGLGWSQFYITYSPYMATYLDLSNTAIAAVFAINTVMVVALQVSIAKWAERRRRTAIYLIASHLLAWSLILTWAAGRVDVGALRFILLATGVAVMTLGEIMVVPVGSALVAGLAGDAGNFGKYMAALELVWTTGAGLGSIVGGLFFDAGRPMLLWPSVVAFIVISTGGYVWLARVLPREVDAPLPAAPTPAPA